MVISNTAMLAGMNREARHEPDDVTGKRNLALENILYRMDLLHHRLRRNQIATAVFRFALVNRFPTLLLAQACFRYAPADLRWAGESLMNPPTQERMLSTGQATDFNRRANARMAAMAAANKKRVMAETSLSAPR